MTTSSILGLPSSQIENNLSGWPDGKVVKTNSEVQWEPPFELHLFSLICKHMVKTIQIINY